MPGPLEGLRVIDFGQYLAGPFGAMLLADLGADVIKVEPTRGDGMRGVFEAFAGCQRGKRDIALDLKQPDGQRIALELVATADVVHHNMTLGTADRLGVGYDDCRAVRPDVVYCNTYMYGATGPLAHMGGLDPLGQAASGVEWEQGDPPVWHRYGQGDIAAALTSVNGVLMALMHRQRTGEGQLVWTSIFHGSMLATADSFLHADGTPSVRPQLQGRGFTPYYRLYETGDGWLQVAAVKESHQAALREILGTDFEAAFMTDLAINWRRRLRQVGVPVEISVETWDGESILFDDELVRLGLVAEYEHPLLGTVRQFGNLITFSATPGRPGRAAPMLGQHTREILEELGYARSQIDALETSGAVAWPGSTYPYRI